MDKNDGSDQHMELQPIRYPDFARQNILYFTSSFFCRKLPIFHAHSVSPVSCFYSNVSHIISLFKIFVNRLRKSGRRRVKSCSVTGSAVWLSTRRNLKSGNGNCVIYLIILCKLYIIYLIIKHFTFLRSLSFEDWRSYGIGSERRGLML